MPTQPALSVPTPEATPQGADPFQKPAAEARNENLDENYAGADRGLMSVSGVALFDLLSCLRTLQSMLSLEANTAKRSHQVLEALPAPCSRDQVLDLLATAEVVIRVVDSVHNC